MNGVEELKNALREDIRLHERLREILAEERKYIESDALELLPGNASRKRAVESEIRRVNDTVSRLFEEYCGNGVHAGDAGGNEVGRLVIRLREAIRDTVTAVGGTIEAVKASRRETVARIREIDARKSAVLAYAKLK